MSNDPHAVSLTKVVEFLRDIGLDPVDADDIKCVHFDPGVLTVVRYRRNEAGRKYATVNGEAATETTVISIEDAPRATVVVDVTMLNDPEPRYLVNE